MGTNYYIKHKDETKNEIFGKVHLGKSSLGWYFNLHVYPERGISNFTDWNDALLKKDNDLEIVDEYGKVYEVDEFLGIVTNRSRENEDIDITKLKESADLHSSVDEKRKLLYMNEGYDSFGPDSSGETVCCMTGYFN